MKDGTPPWSRMLASASASSCPVVTPGRTAARTSRAATILGAHRLPEHRAPELADMAPPAWVLVNVPMTALSSSAIRAARRAAAARPDAGAPLAGLGD